MTYKDRPIEQKYLKILFEEIEGIHTGMELDLSLDIIELDIKNKISFDDIAVCTNTIYSTLNAEPECNETVKKIQRNSEIAQIYSIEELKEEINWKWVYNLQIINVLSEYEIEEVFVDKLGAYGWIDSKGNFHFDKVRIPSLFPLYPNEIALLKDLIKQFPEKVGPDVPTLRRKRKRKKIREELRQKRKSRGRVRN